MRAFCRRRRRVFPLRASRQLAGLISAGTSIHELFSTLQPRLMARCAELFFRFTGQVRTEVRPLLREPDANQGGSLLSKAMVVRHWFPPGFTRFCIASSTIHIRSYCITQQSCQSVNGDWMSTQKCELVHLTLFKHGAKSFLAALDDAGIPHGPVRMYSSAPKNSGLVEAITALSDAMPWNAIAKVIIAWIDARKSREVIIYTEGGESFHAKGYSASDVQKLLQISTNVAIIDTKPADEQ